MLRLVFWIAVIAAAVWLVRRLLARSVEEKPQGSGPPLEGDLVVCAQCGVHLPRAEAKAAEGRLYCSEEHAQLGARP